MSSVRNLIAGVDKWEAGGVPTTMMMNIERRHGADKPVIQKALVDLEGAPFKFFAEHRAEWARTESYSYPGPIQYFGPSEVCDVTNHTLVLERSK
jgi:pyrophosphate--fructose-6-phosphate 1-phosphotransferase